MVSILFFELKRLCLQRHLSKITEIEKSFLENFEGNLKDVSINIIFTHFQIREYLKNKKETLKLLISDSDLKNEDIIKEIKYIINETFITNRKNLE